MTDADVTYRPSLGAERRKTLLICQECAFESPIDGDWALEDDGEHIRLRCPRCESTVTERPKSIASAEKTCSDGPSLSTCHC